MTGRRRHSGGSHHRSGGSPTTRGGDGTDSGSRRPGGSGNGVGTNLDGIDTMASRLDATRGRVESVGNTVRGVNVGPQSMGVIGSGFAGAAQSHLRTAEQHVARTTRAVEQAQRGTAGTAQAYRQTDASNASNLSNIDTTTRPPATRAPSASTTPSGTTNVATPRTAPAGGGGGENPPHHGTGGSSGTPVSWRDDLKNHFTPSELKELNTAMDKMAADPKRGEVPGSGQLTQRERELLARAQHLVVITPDTLMQKVLPPGALDNYLGGGDPNNPRFDPNQVGGYVARQQDATHLRTPADLIQGNRLDYENTPFTDTTKPVHVMEFPAGNHPYTTPFGAPYAGGSGTHGNWGVVQRAADDMITAADSQGHAPGSYSRQVYKWPFSGVGLTADAALGIPERTTPYHQLPVGSKIYEYSPSGTKVLVAEYGGAARGWIDLRTPTTP